MAKEPRSYVRRRRRGCLSGCLTRLLLLLGLLALLLVGACVLGFVRIDPSTGAPSLSVESAGLSGVSLPQVDLSGFTGWAYGVPKESMTLKTLRAGGGEAVLVCCDGYTMLLGGGKNGLLTAAQMLLCGVNRLSVAAMTSADKAYAGGLPLAVKLGKPQYLLCPGSQTKTSLYNDVLAAAQAAGAQTLAPKQGQTFGLGRAWVTVIGPSDKPHTDECDDGLSVRIDYGNTSVLVLGAITVTGEAELLTSPANLDADVLVCAQGGSDEATSARLIQAVTPKAALLTGSNPSNDIRMRLDRAGATVYAMRENGVMTVVSDGEKIEVRP